MAIVCCRLATISKYEEKWNYRNIKQKNTHHWVFFCFLSLLSLFMHSVLPAPIAILVKLDFTLNKFFVLASPVVYALAGLAGEFD